jgi:hypothetical protein
LISVNLCKDSSLTKFSKTTSSATFDTTDVNEMGRRWLYSRLLQVSALEEGQYPLLSTTVEDTGSSPYTKDSKSLLQDRPVDQRFL